MMWKDVRYAVRMLARQPAFTLVAVLTLALGIGANTAIFTLFDAVLLQSLPVREPNRLVLFDDSMSSGTSTGSVPVGRWTLFSHESYQFLRDQRLPFESLAALRSGETAVAVRLPGLSGQQAERAQAHLVSGSYFAVMGVDAAMGRTFAPEDDRPNAAPVAVISYQFWSDRLHSDPAIVGKTAIVNGTSVTIAGVAPREFFGERVQRPPDFWIPLVFQPQIELRPSYLEKTNAYWLNLIARLPSGGTRAQAQVAATHALQQFLTGTEGSKLTPDRAREIKESRIELVDGAAGVSFLRFRYSEPLHILLAVVALVLLLACANVGNLLLSRAAVRRAEMSVRRALGATRGRLVRQMLIESGLLAASGAVCGVLLARWAASLLAAAIVSNGSPVHAGLDLRVLAFTLAVTALSAVVFGLMPAVSAAGEDMVTALKAGGRGSARNGGNRLTAALVVAQIAISLVLLVGANLFTRSLLNLEHQPFGFDDDHVLLARISPRLAGYTQDNVAMLHRRLYDRISTLPGIRSATIARYSPLGGSRSINSGVVEGYQPKPGASVEFETQIVGPSYPETLGMPLLRGRAIGLQDGAGAQNVAMVNDAFVRQFMPDENPIGRHFGFGDSGAGDIEIVGVLKDARFQDDREAVKPVVFTALLQNASQFALETEIELRTNGEPTGAAAELRRAVAEIDPNLPMNDPKTLHSQVSANFDSQRLGARLVSTFGLLALVLACVGLYGVITQGVERRTNEIGIRMALGAQRREVMWMILRDVLVLLAIGVAVGVPMALGAVRFIASQLYGVSAAAPSSVALAAAVLGVVAVVTGMLPARRASRVDPIVALRAE